MYCRIEHMVIKKVTYIVIELLFNSKEMKLNQIKKKVT